MTDPTFHERPHRPSDPAPGPQSAYAARVAAATKATAAHMDAARQPAAILVARTRALVNNGVDLRNPERACDFITDQVHEAVRAAAVPGCSCNGSEGTAALVLVAELARQVAEATR